MAPQAVLDRMQSMAPMRPTETMAQQALGGGTGGTYLAPALYRPVVQARCRPLPPACCSAFPHAPHPAGLPLWRRPRIAGTDAGWPPLDALVCSLTGRGW